MGGNKKRNLIWLCSLTIWVVNGRTNKGSLCKIFQPARLGLVTKQELENKKVIMLFENCSTWNILKGKQNEKP